MAVEHLPQQPFALAVATLLLPRQAPCELGNAMVAAQRKYQFLPGDVPITLITATVRSEDDAFLPPHMGWHGYAPRVVVREVEASHMSMCVGSNAVKVAAEIDRALA